MVSKINLLGNLPTFRDDWRLISNSQTVGGIIDQVIAAHKKCADSYDRIAPFFYGGDTLRKLFRFCKQNLPYQVESDKEQSTRSPGAILTLSDSIGVDCKHYAQFIGGVLSALNRSGLGSYDWVYRFASYDGSRTPDHVFVVVRDGAGGETWLDPTPIQIGGGQWIERSYDDRQLVPTYSRDKKIKDMSLYHVSGSRMDFGAENPHSNRNVGLSRGTGATVGIVGVDDISGAASMIANLLPSGALKDWLVNFAKDPVGSIVTLIKGRTYTSGDYILGEYYMRNILGMPEIQTRGQVPDNVVPQSWVFWSVALGTPVRNSDDLYALYQSVNTYMTRPNSFGATADPEQAERARKVLISFGYPECLSDGRRNNAWPLSQFVSVPYIGKMKSAEANVLYTGIHPITGANYVNGVVTSTGSGGTLPGGGGSGGALDPFRREQTPSTIPWKGIIITAAVLGGGYLVLSKPKSKK